jgi:hypothetical protein
MRRPRQILLLGRLSIPVIASMMLGSCREELTNSQSDGDVCPQTAEFGNLGCTDVVISFAAPRQPWPANFV